MTNVVDGLAKGPITDSTIIQIVALIGWIAWLQVALSIVVETVAWARGLTAPAMALRRADPAGCRQVGRHALRWSCRVGTSRPLPWAPRRTLRRRSALVQATFA